MKQQTRLIILLICVLLFLAITPYLILYSLGYRIDFKHRKIVATGGIYVRIANPEVNVTIDNAIKSTTGLFSNYAFVQNLLPGIHSVDIQKDNYYSYQKNLEVLQNQVTKIEDVVLFKQRYAFSLLGTTVSSFTQAPDNTTILAAAINKTSIAFQIINTASDQKQSVGLALPNAKILDVKWSQDSKKAILNISSNYYLLDLTSTPPKIIPLPQLTGATQISFNPQNSNELLFLKGNALYMGTNPQPVLENVIAYTTSNQTITWLSNDGFLYSTNIQTAATIALSTHFLTISPEISYKLIIASGRTLLQESNATLLLNPTDRTFESLGILAKAFEASPDQQKILYCNDHEIGYVSFAVKTPKLISLNKSTDIIGNCDWIGSHYVIFTQTPSKAPAQASRLIISETDTDGTINTITLSQPLDLVGSLGIILNQPQIAFSQNNKKLYILTQGSLIESERLIP